MRPTPLIYIETSVFGFCFDPMPHNVLKREAAVLLFRQVSAGVFSAVTSPLTTTELNRAAEPLRNRMLELLDDVAELELDAEEVERLAATYVGDGVVPADYLDDARHAAFASIAGADVLVSMKPPAPIKRMGRTQAERSQPPRRIPPDRRAHTRGGVAI